MTEQKNRLLFTSWRTEARLEQIAEYFLAMQANLPAECRAALGNEGYAPVHSLFVIARRFDLDHGSKKIERGRHSLPCRLGQLPDHVSAFSINYLLYRYISRCDAV